MNKWLVMGISGLFLGGVAGLSGCEKRSSETNEVLEDKLQTQKVVQVPEENQTPVEITIGVVGDVMLGRSVNTRMLKYKDDKWPFFEVVEVLAGYDLTLGNLENPLIEGCKSKDEGMIFCGRPEATLGLVAAGFDGIGLENNHILNYGEAGKAETIEWLNEAGVLPIVQGGGREFEIEGVRMGVLAFDDVSKSLSEQEVIGEIEQWKDKVEVLMVMIHWGVEYVDIPNERQQFLGRQMIEAGADVVVGSHPHWTQTVEEYGDGVIFYSLGNFVFDQMWSEQTRLGSIALIKLKTQNSKLKTMEYELIPVKIYDYGQPRIVDSIQ